jgi:hypothetical protein
MPSTAVSCGDCGNKKRSIHPLFFLDAAISAEALPLSSSSSLSSKLDCRKLEEVITAVKIDYFTAVCYQYFFLSLFKAAVTGVKPGRLTIPKSAPSIQQWWGDGSIAATARCSAF